MKFICLDGKIITASTPSLSHQNRSFRYGDGLFETMKMISGRVILKEFHFERLFTSLQLLKYRVPDSFVHSLLENKIKELADKNDCSALCRIRLTIFRGNGNLYPTAESLNYMIECIALNSLVNEFNEKGLSIGIYKGAQKTCDSISSIKSANFLPYVMATIHTEENKMDDCILLNTKGNIADTTIANLFFIKSGKIFTPSLDQGCINGVMRKYVLNKLKENKYTCSETGINEKDLQESDEIFLTNAINGIRWVENFAGKKYGYSLTRKIYDDFVYPVFT